MKQLCVAHYPSVNELDANPYWVLLKNMLIMKGCKFINDSSYGIRWLWENRGKVDIVHYHYIQSLYAYENTHARLRWVLRLMRNLLVARLLGYRTIFTVHDLNPTWPLMPGWVDYLGHWAAVNLCDRVIVHCQAARREVAKIYGRRRGVVVVQHPNYCEYYPNEIDQPTARQRLGIEINQTVYCFLGGIRPNKGVDSLIEAFHHIEDQNALLLIAGKLWPPIDYLAHLENLAKQDSRIRLDIRYIPDDEIQIFLNAADVVVLPFREILTSGSAVLAMSFGRPVIVPGKGCVPEQVGSDCGLIYDPDAPLGLLKALQKVPNLDLKSMGMAARKRVSELTPERFARETMDVYLGNG